MLKLAGYFTVDSGQAMVGDPVYLDEWDSNKNDEWNLDGKEGQYSYHGATSITVTKSFGELGNAKAVVFSTGRGDGMYPVYVEHTEEGIISTLIIDFEGTIDLERENNVISKSEKSPKIDEYDNAWQVELKFEPTGDYMNFTYETDNEDEDSVVLEIINGLSVVVDKLS
jgi:hypothetical protein